MFQPLPPHHVGGVRAAVGRDLRGLRHLEPHQRCSCVIPSSRLDSYHRYDSDNIVSSIKVWLLNLSWSCNQSFNGLLLDFCFVSVFAPLKKQMKYDWSNFFTFSPYHSIIFRPQDCIPYSPFPLLPPPNPPQLGLKVIICFVTQTLFLWFAPTLIAQLAAEDQSSRSQWGPRSQDSRFVHWLLRRVLCCAESA